MKMTKSIQKPEAGVGHLLVLLAVVVIAAVAVVGYRVINSQNDTLGNTGPTAPKADLAPADIKSSSDLKAAESALNQSNVDKDLDPAQLDSDINSLL